MKSCILVLAAARKNKPFILEEARDVFLPVASPTSPSKREEVMSVKQVFFSDRQHAGSSPGLCQSVSN